MRYNFNGSRKNLSLLHWSIQIYLAITEILFFTGPWNWEIINFEKFILFLFGVHVSIFLGYSYFIHRYISYSIYFIGSFSEKRLLKYISFFLLINLVLCLPTSLSRTDSFLPNVFEGLQDVGRAYNSNHENKIYGNPYAFIEYIRIIISPFLIGINAIIAFYWLNMDKKLKIISIFIILFNISIYISIGTNKGIADAAILLPLFIHFRRLTTNQEYNIFYNKTNFFGAIFLIIFLIFFGMTQELRMGNVGVDGVFNTGTYLIYADPEATPTWMGRDVLIIYQSLTRYLTSGYQALIYSFDINNSATFGFTNSSFMIENIDSFLSTNYFYENSFPAILEKKYGWSNYYLWHTAYVWLASDFGYFGTLIIISYFSYKLFKSIIIIISFFSIIHVILVQQLLIFFVYLPANNQVFQNGEGFFGTLIILFLSIYWEKRYLFKSNKK